MWALAGEHFPDHTASVDDPLAAADHITVTRAALEQLPTPVAGPNKVWPVDFHFDATTDERPVKIVSVID